MSNRREKQKKKARVRNQRVLERYKELRSQSLKVREALDFLADEFDLSGSTVNKILFDPTYADSPLSPA